MMTMRGLKVTVVGAALCAALGLAAPAAAEAPARADYVAHLDRICSASGRPAVKLFPPLDRAGKRFAAAKKDHVSEAEVVSAAKHFFTVLGRTAIKLSKIRDRMATRIGTVPPPAQDAGTAKQWVALQHQLAHDLLVAGRASKRFDFVVLEKIKKEFTDDKRDATALVATWGFQYCSPPPRPKHKRKRRKPSDAFS
jgi:hypothetical protein